MSDILCAWDFLNIPCSYGIHRQIERRLTTYQCTKMQSLSQKTIYPISANKIYFRVAKWPFFRIL